ncbi:hypothetical protein SAICODRAFT_30196 [Saitoella complicata NRRL Y-17804]|nr:uncharacterized protein SAICODRAFT_30196 [Saitoella complicata NRRL Y-17804]ODQ53537.1 hypothetical protein SAICODRAFT_30196 [Saitoella complicata NRRL Y-17804]
MGILDNLYSVVELGHFEWPVRNSHPTHPMTVHFPLTFLSAAYTADLLHYGIQHLGPLARFTPYLADISKFGYVSNILGLLTSIPSITSGSAELWELYKTGGINRKDKELTHPKSHEEYVDRSVRIGLYHGALNAVAFSISTYNWWVRRKIPGFHPTGGNVLLSAIAMGGIAFSAGLGGELVYGKAVGVQRMGYARDEKIEGRKEGQALADAKAQ